MHAHALKRKTSEEAKSESFASFSPAVPMTIHKQSACACGGGCPKCLNKHNAREQSFAIQKKSLEISDPTDASEIEADEIARKVVNGQPAAIHETSATLNRKGRGSAETTPEFQSKLENSKGGGQSLDDSTRIEMESKMGADFSGVKIHTGGDAHNLNESVNAKAFTHGQDIFFRQGEFNSSSKEGKELLAHELVHTKQQKGIHTKIVARQQTKITPTVSTTDLIKKSYYKNPGKEGGFLWVINWHTNQKNGWIVQKIENQINITNCVGKALSPDTENTKTLWEAWQVMNGSVLGGDEPGTDGWTQPDAGVFVIGNPTSNHQGTWKTKGTVYFVDKLDTTKGGWKKDAVGVWTTYTDPKITTPSRLIRSAGGKYSCCGTVDKWYHNPL